MISSIVFATHKLKPANPFPSFRLWPLTRLSQVNIRCGSPQFQHSSRLSSVCLLTHLSNSDPVRGSLSLTHLESILAKVYQNKQLQPLLELYTYEKCRGGGVMVNQQQPGSHPGLVPPPSHPPVPLQRAALGATMGSGERNLRHPRETTPLYPVSNRSERTSVTATARRRPGLQVVPGSTVLTVDRSRVARTSIQVLRAEKHRVGKAGSVRMG